MRRANIVVSTPTLILQPPPNLESRVKAQDSCRSISGLVVEYIVAIDVTRVRFPADAFLRKGPPLAGAQIKADNTCPEGEN